MYVCMYVLWYDCPRAPLGRIKMLHMRWQEVACTWGGLNCEANAQVLVVTPSPLFFLEVGRKKGGRNSGAVRYYCTEVLVLLL